MTQSSSLSSILQLLLAQFAIGVNIVLARYLVPHFPIALLLELRFLLGSIMLWGLVKLNKQSILRNKIGMRLVFKDWWVLFLQALCGGYLFNIFLLHGLRYTDATMAGIICSTIPAIIALFSFFLLKEELSGGKILSIIIAVAGLIIISYSTKHAMHFDNAHLWGGILILFAIIPEALFTILAKWHGSHMHAYVMALIINIFNALLFLPSALIALHNTRFIEPNIFQWSLILLYALSGGVVFFVCWYRGLEHSTANTAALMTAAMPISTAFLAWLFLHETITLPMLIGMSCVMLSIVFGAEILP